VILLKIGIHPYNKQKSIDFLPNQNNVGASFARQSRNEARTKNTRTKREKREEQCLKILELY